MSLFTEEEKATIGPLANAYEYEHLHDPMASLRFWSQCADRKRKWLEAEKKLELREIGRDFDLEVYEYQAAHGMEPYPYLVRYFGPVDPPWRYRMPDHLRHLDGSLA